MENDEVEFLNRRVLKLLILLYKFEKSPQENQQIVLRWHIIDATWRVACLVSAWTCHLECWACWDRQVSDANRGQLVEKTTWPPFPPKYLVKSLWRLVILFSRSLLDLYYSIKLNLSYKVIIGSLCVVKSELKRASLWWGFSQWPHVFFSPCCAD